MRLSLIRSYAVNILSNAMLITQREGAAAGSLLNDQLSRIAESLGLPAEALNVFSEPCSKLGAEKTATMLRLFRYEGSGKDEPTTVAERQSTTSFFIHRRATNHVQHTEILVFSVS